MPEKRKKKVVGFFRRGGKVIPVFEKKQAREGAALTGAGLAVSGGGAVLAGKLRNRAFKLKNISDSMNQNVAASMSRQISMDFLTSSKVVKGVSSSTKKAQASAFKKLSKATMQGKAAVFSFKKSRLFSAALVGLGTEKLLSASGFNDKEIFPEVSSEFVGVGAAALNDAISNRAFRKVALGESLRKGFKSDLSKAGKFTASIFKKVAKKRLGF